MRHSPEKIKEYLQLAGLTSKSYSHVKDGLETYLLSRRMWSTSGVPQKPKNTRNSWGGPVEEERPDDPMQ
eukprot:1349396-Lingulodinium_polyedra.AAC.1